MKQHAAKRTIGNALVYLLIACVGLVIMTRDNFGHMLRRYVIYPPMRRLFWLVTRMLGAGSSWDITSTRYP